MKIRIKGNSVRIRLGQSEVARFGQEGYLEERTEFGNSTLIYALKKKETDDGLSASFDGNRITLYMPAGQAHEWTTTDVVGYDNRMDIGNGKQLFLLLEKDFVCLDNTFEDQSDNYPNPNAAC